MQMDNTLDTTDLLIFSFLVSQGKVHTLNKWDGKINHLLMAYSLSDIFTKNYSN